MFVVRISIPFVIGMSNLTHEWEVMAGKMFEVKNMVRTLAKLTSRVALHEMLVDSDLTLMEELLLSYLAREATPSHALRLSAKSGLSSTTHFVPTFWELAEVGGETFFSVVFDAVLLQRASVLAVSEEYGHLVVRTGERAYLLHQGTSLEGISLGTPETRLTGVKCEGCGLLVHYQSEVYRAVTAGGLTCWSSGEERALAVELGEMVKLAFPLNCSNLAMSLGAARLRLRDIGISDNTKEPDGYRELQNTLADGAFTKEREAAEDGHRRLQLKLQADQEAAQGSLELFVKDTDRDFANINAGNVASFTWLSVLTVVVTMCVAFVAYRMCRAATILRKATVASPPAV